MDAEATAPFCAFSEASSIRVPPTWHLLIDISSIVILAVLCGAEGWEMVEAWGCGNLEWLATFLELPTASPRTIPSTASLPCSTCWRLSGASWIGRRRWCKAAGACWSL